MKRKFEVQKIEKDEVLFRSSSVGTIIKNFAEKHFGEYQDLNNKQKYVIGLSLNSIIDLCDETVDSQKELFEESEWEVLKNKFRKKHQVEGDRNFQSKLKAINKAMQNCDLKKAYILARKEELRSLNSEDETLFNIYAHIINIYRFRKSSITKKDNTELDAFIKIWGEVFESLFNGTNSMYCKWGESKAANNEFKVDCRIVFCFDDKEVDLTDVEAARYMHTKKANTDHLKLAIETKDILDFVVKHSISFDPQDVYIYMIQICGNNCEVNTLSLVDNGLYCVDHSFDLTITASPVTFANKACEWFQNLFNLKTNCDKITNYLDAGTKKSYNAHFARAPSLYTSTYISWLRDSFYPPSEDGENYTFPKLFYGDPSFPHKKQ
ncbi:unnamed protein product [Rhizopus stolonifer]